jgi:ATP-dependent Clp protease ATP-binding subunit ClpC
MAERELSLNLSETAKDLLVEKGWDPAMGARPLRRAIQRYIEDPLADKVLATSMEPGSTVEVDKAPDGEDPEVTIDVVAPKTRKRQTVGVGAKGGEGEGEGEPSGDDSPAGDLPENPEVLPEVPDAPPAAESESSDDD